MGRWGSELYDSDQALDYHATIEDRLDREIAYQVTLEHISETPHWLRQMLGIIEMMLLFEQHDKGSTVYIHEEKAVQRWRDVFFSIWDADWRETDPYVGEFPYGTPEYRQEHRAIVVDLFDRLQSIARMWEDISANGKSSDLPLSPLTHPLPYFSITRRKVEDREFIYVPHITAEIIMQLVKDILYWLSAEKRSEALVFGEQDVWVAADVLGFLCETYEHTPLVNAQMVRNWRETTVAIWKQFETDDGREWDENDPLYQNVMQVFDRLEAVAQKYPPEEW